MKNINEQSKIVYLFYFNTSKFHWGRVEQSIKAKDIK